MLQIQKKLAPLFYVLLSLPATAMGFALCVQISALSWLLSGKYNLEIDTVGYVWMAGPLAGILGQLLVGFASDKTWIWGGRRRPYIIAGGTLAALMLICLPNLDRIAAFFGTANLFPVALTVALLFDISINISFNPTRSLIADVTPPGKMRTKGYTWMQTVSGTFGVAAYFIGAQLGNYTLIYSGIFIVLLCSVIPVLFIQEPKELIPASEEVIIKPEEQKTSVAQFLKICFANGFAWIGVQTMFVFMFSYLSQVMYHTADLTNMEQDQKDHVGKVINYSFLILNAVGALLPSVLIEPLTRRNGRVHIHSLFILVMSVAYTGIIFFGKQPSVIYCFMALAGMGWACIVSLPFAIMSENVSKNKMGFFMGVFNLSIVIPQLLVSAFVGTIVKNAADKNIVFIISASSLFVSFIFWRWVKEKKITV